MSDHPTARDRPPPVGASRETARAYARTIDPDAAERGDDVPWMVDRFVIVEELGAGGMGRVYLGYDPSLDRKVAIKLLREEPFVDVERAHARMAHEARAMARLRHPNVVTVHEVGKHEGRVFIVMEYVAGGTLRHWLDDGGDRQTWQAIVAMYVAAGRGLEAAHAAGVVHRDFKPDNVLVERGSNRVLVTDFGIANAFGEEQFGASGERVSSTGLTRTGALIGTPPYMSPEQHQSSAMDARTDQFSFCASLYEALYGIRPFAGDDLAAIASNAILGEITPPRIDRKVPARVAAAVARGLRPEADDRFPTLTALLAELVVVQPSSRRWIAPVAGALAVAAGSVAWVATRQTPDPPDPNPGPACDCELFAVEVPPGARVVGFTPVAVTQPALRVASAGPRLEVPRGHHTIDYEAGGVVYSFAVVSGGIGAARTIALPAPEPRDGYAFVPGGEIPIGDLAGDGAKDERPPSTIRLAPYLIAKREEPQLLNYEAALSHARAAHARLPTAAEWEWAARLGVLERPLANQWEWTATRFAPYPYDDERDDPLAEGTTIEIRGGQVGDCDASHDRRAAACSTETGDRPRVSRRLEGRRGGAAELRLVRAPASVPIARELRVELVDGSLGPRDRVRLHRFIWDWTARDRPGALLVASSTNATCTFFGAFAGFDTHQIEVIHDDALPANQIIVRANPNAAYRDERGRTVCTDSSIEVLDQFCFEGERLLRSSDAIVTALANTLVGNPSIRKVEIGVYVPDGTADAMQLSQRRAEVVQARLIAEGVAKERLVARGYGAVPERVETVQRQRTALLSGNACVSGGRVEPLILERN